jgi:antitoxin component HigA of HigAB toxin-antitoxin module
MERALEIVPIKNDRDYRRTLKEIEGLMHAERNTPEGGRLDMLVTLVEGWEAQSAIRSTRNVRSLATSRIRYLHSVPDMATYRVNLVPEGRLPEAFLQGGARLWCPRCG